MKPSPEVRASVDVIRHAARTAVHATSLRVIAAQVGISAMTLRAFLLEGNEPQPRTLRKLRTWYADHAATLGNSGEHEARIVVTLLLTLYPPSVHARVQHNFLAERERDYREAGMQPPPWIATLRAELPPLDPD